MLGITTRGMLGVEYVFIQGVLGMWVTCRSLSWLGAKIAGRTGYIHNCGEGENHRRGVFSAGTDGAGLSEEVQKRVGVVRGRYVYIKCLLGAELKRRGSSLLAAKTVRTRCAVEVRIGRL